MTVKELEKRIGALENATVPDEMPGFFVCLVSPGQVADGWRIGDTTYRRKPDETDDALFSRIRKAINPAPCSITLLHQVAGFNIGD